jgi:hypothetical protein
MGKTNYGVTFKSVYTYCACRKEKLSLYLIMRLGVKMYGGGGIAGIAPYIQFHAQAD